MQKKDFPLVSVIMLTYSHENYIRQAIEGVLMQKYKGKIELIIANDSSPDGTDEIIRDIIKHNKNASWIKYYKHDRNKGMRENSFWALKQAKGKYIALCEGDDYWTDALKLQKQIEYLEDHTKVNICATNGDWLIDEELVSRKKYTKTRHFTKYNFHKKNSLLTATVVYRYMNRHPLYLKECKYGDISLWRYLTLNGGEAVSLQDKTAVYRIHSKGFYSGATQKERISCIIHDRIVFFKNNKSFKLYIIYLYLFIKEGVKISFKKKKMYLYDYLNAIKTINKIYFSK